LGDSILAAIVAHYLFKRYPDEDEGKLSKLKSQLVARPSLVVWAREIELGNTFGCRTGKKPPADGIGKAFWRTRLRRFLGALFLDGGFPVAQRFIVRLVSKKKRIIETDYKSKLQEIIQKRYKVAAGVHLKEQKGPDHNKTFFDARSCSASAPGGGRRPIEKRGRAGGGLGRAKENSRPSFGAKIDPTHMAEDNTVAVPPAAKTSR
jgi:ribonuclease-3